MISDAVRSPSARRVATTRLASRFGARPWGLLLAGVLAVAIFWPCLHYGFAMDDFALIEAGRSPLAVGVPAHFVPHSGIHYRPLGQYGYFWLADRLFGYRSLPFHVANLLLHLVNVALAWWLLRRFVADRLASGLATLFFALHSALFLVAAWAALAGEAIPVCCFLAALSCYATYLEGRGRGWWLATLAALVGALLAKQVAVALPLALILYQLLFHPHRGRLGRWRVPLAPSSAALLIPLALYAWFILRVSGPHQSGPYHLVLGPAALRTGLTYLLWTVDLPRVADDYPPALLVAAAAGLAALLAFAVRRRDRALLFGLGWFACFVAPVVPLPEHMFHYYLYAPLFGAALVAGRLGELLLAGSRAAPRALAGAVVALVLLAGNWAGVATELAHDPTMVQAGQARRALAVLEAEHPTPPGGATFDFVAPADHVYYVLGYGAAVRLAYPGTPLRVGFEGIAPAGRADGPVYRYRWDGETIVPVPAGP